MIEFWGNIVEGTFWIFVATVILFKSRSMEKNARLNAIIAATAFFVFGISDFIESTTGAWYRPLSLLLLKATCILIFLICHAKHKKLAENSKNNEKPSLKKGTVAEKSSILNEE